MDTPAIDERFLIAGQEYGDALAELGLDPHALFWAYDRDEKRHVLVLITDFFDFKGPLEISRQLFRAYNASATPQEIDPFVVRLHSVNQMVGGSLNNFVSGGWTFNKMDKVTGKPDGLPMEFEAFAQHGLEIKKGWVIRHRKIGPARKSVELGRRWDRFTRNVDKVAA
ncbi:hypothetical protein FJV76_32285 [Mesorhizobium sp. WSM4303]|uniref:hypothetical protein n=1 Tax=unclassified Mesorhizobium TaxID=325217 RepID=UPI00115EB292|nr:MULTISPECIES: hypothetical protein [unclassified Mesorhizobium]TRC92180.1 hypothetical protein FJV77_25875 [Mesorhizobium sp. WSM4306]TRC92811.1 hypothetical protein FJV76_32285 [Mesorhizobium sp. WSM4303]